MQVIERMTEEAIDEEINKIKKQMKGGLFIPVHHYQRDEIVQFADFVGDSLELSRVSAQTESRYVVFCGVYFMAEIARILVPGDKTVCVPDLSAGCPLADLASTPEVESVWNKLQKINPGIYVPVVYANSHASLKAFCGRNNGLVCTSSNVQTIFEHILKTGKKVFFMPDRNLGINTARAMGLEDRSIIVDHYNTDNITDATLKDKEIVVWNGYCVVHLAFNVSQVEYWRKKMPDAKVIVHPECEPEVVMASDYSGSTSKIKKMIENSSSGSKWVIGTEYNMVQRLAKTHPDKVIVPLEKSVCANMSKNNRQKLLKVLRSLGDEKPLNTIDVDEDTSRYAKLAIQRMLELSK